MKVRPLTVEPSWRSTFSGLDGRARPGTDSDTGCGVGTRPTDVGHRDDIRSRRGHCRGLRPGPLPAATGANADSARPRPRRLCRDRACRCVLRGLVDGDRRHLDGAGRVHDRRAPLDNGVRRSGQGRRGSRQAAAAGGLLHRHRHGHRPEASGRARVRVAPVSSGALADQVCRDLRSRAIVSPWIASRLP